MGLQSNINLIYDYLFFPTLKACWGVSNNQNQQQHKHTCNYHKETTVTQQGLPYTDKRITMKTDCYTNKIMHRIKMRRR